LTGCPCGRHSSFARKGLQEVIHDKLGLYRLSTLMMSLAHRTVVLCGTKDLQCVYELCRTAYFDDYALFWPMTNDTQRLPMAVTHALRDLDRSKCGVPAAEMAR